MTSSTIGGKVGRGWRREGLVKTIGEDLETGIVNCHFFKVFE